jgi:predicted amidophosphoribosyltransferase
MQPVEIALFVVVAVLAVALIAYAVRPHLKARRTENRPEQPPEAAQAGADLRSRGPALICPACHRDYAPGLRFCPHDARDLIPATDPIARASGSGATCPTCKRSFDAGKKFCAFDGEELVPLPLAIGGSDVDIAGGLGKICPSCSRRYESDATFCGRDGAELVSVN